MDPELQGAAVLAAELAHGNENNVLAAAEGVLQRSRLNHRTQVRLMAALAVLTYHDQLSSAAAWCDSLIEEAVARHSPTWHALFEAERALISVRQGDLAGAEKHADTALNLIPPSSWSVAVGLPLAAMVLAKTSMGDLQQAADFLDIPVPEAMFQTRMGVHYLYARGRHHLAADRAQAALSDFRSCRRLMRSWGIDLPTVEPWRIGAAQAHLMLGDPAAAAQLMDEQLALLAPEHVRTRGLSLRVQATFCDLESRQALLTEAVDLVERCGDRLELAYALSDQSQTCRMLGQHEQARTLARKAHALAQKCGAGVLERTGGLGGSNSDSGPPTRLIADLSDAERRVAALAADGCTNREISRKLYITVSTVEQHLTKIYRKLNVKRFGLQSAMRRYDVGPGGPDAAGQTAASETIVGRHLNVRNGRGSSLAACHGG